MFGKSGNAGDVTNREKGWARFFFASSRVVVVSISAVERQKHLVGCLSLVSGRNAHSGEYASTLIGSDAFPFAFWHRCRRLLTDCRRAFPLFGLFIS